MTNSPPKPNSNPSPTPCHDQCSFRSVRGPLPRSVVMSTASPAASTVGAPTASASIPADNGPLPPSTTANAAEARKWTSPTSKKAPKPQRGTESGTGAENPDGPGAAVSSTRSVSTAVTLPRHASAGTSRPGRAAGPPSRQASRFAQDMRVERTGNYSVLPRRAVSSSRSAARAMLFAGVISCAATSRARARHCGVRMERRSATRVSWVVAENARPTPIPS